ncbi:hypothetical protein PRJ39_06410 [Lysobacter enzymogenes]|uniref:hypothetical protein n=1 Tax=Lysobacter TaxID=68 RepID=UPI0011142D56|nr:hypothetical protein [Lysobacter sp. yr284]
MRHLTFDDAVSALRRGRVVDQLIEIAPAYGTTVIRYVSVTPTKEGSFDVSLIERFDEGRPDFLDVYAFSYVDPDPPHGSTENFPAPGEALAYAQNELGCSGDKFVNEGVIQDEYRDRKFG